MRALRRSLIIGAVLFAAPALAAEPENWNFQGQKYLVYFDETLHEYLSTACRDAECGAKNILAQARTVDIASLNIPPHAPDGGWHVGARICKLFGGTVAMARDDRGNENSFCIAPDQTLINLRSLSH
ncbi:exported hypothetical protein [Candidatus Terasakiella magnetica]|nr:exported hypothetical protein [Candidatus Terasakiella magnetica]